MARCICPITGRSYNQGPIMYSHLTHLCCWTLKSRIQVADPLEDIAHCNEISAFYMRWTAIELWLCVWMSAGFCKGCCRKRLPYILLIRCFAAALRKCKQLPGKVLILVDTCKWNGPDSELRRNLARSFLPRTSIDYTWEGIIRDAKMF